MSKVILLLASLLGTWCFVLAEVPYGVCAHVTRSERSVDRLKSTLNAMELAGVRYVRSDFDAEQVVRKDGSWDFSYYDALVADLENRGVTLLPILYAEENPPKDFKKYRAYIQKVIRHYGRKFPVVEIWNEPNLDGFFRGCDPVQYAQTLKVAYEAVKSVDPRVRVAFGGTAGVPFDWIRKVYASGAAKSFDIMAIHPYSHPHRPEGVVDVNIEKLRMLMSDFGVGDKPIWVTEVGWPTHTQSIASQHILLAGLKVARPEQKSWRIVVADVKLDGTAPDQEVAEVLKAALPVGSTAAVCTQRETIRRLAAGEADAVVYPFDESFPSETIDAVNEFIRTGGVFVEFGGMPCYNGQRDTEHVKELTNGAAIGRFPFGALAWWMDPDGKYPEEAQLFATPAGVAAGVKQEPTGFKSMRFLVPDRIGQGSEWIPLVAGKGADGTELVSAAVVRYHGERTGAAVLCSLMTDSFVTTDEENQSRFTARCAGLAFAESVEGYFPYNLRAFEDDPYYSEDHFGLMHADFTPKPAFAAYAHFTRERPVGSVNLQGKWHDAERAFYFPQWTRPDGKVAGMLWTTGKPERRKMKFMGGVPEFRNMYGRKMGDVRQVSDGVFDLELSGSPIYFSGAEIDQFPILRANLRIRDPFVVADSGMYYLYESKPWDGGKGVNVFESRDLEHWSERKEVLRIPDSVENTAVWAPEVHKYCGKWYLFVTLTMKPGAWEIKPMPTAEYKPGRLQPRGTWIYVSDSPSGPFVPIGSGSVTPKDWMCLDGTFFEENGKPYMVFCHEWCQVGDGRMMLAELKPDLSGIVGEPKELFRASSVGKDCVVTDGPFLWRSPKCGKLFMSWSNQCEGGYSVYLKESVTGSVYGPWKNSGKLFEKDGGHGMVFRDFKGNLKFVLHQPNESPNERMRIFDLCEEDGKMSLRTSRN